MRQQNLDGKTPITPAPFDAYEKVARAQHEEAPKEPGHVHSGLQVVEDAEKQEYPKAVDHVEHPSGVGLQPVIVNSAEEEKAYADAKAADVKTEPKAE